MVDLKHAEMPSDEMLVAFLDGELMARSARGSIG